MRKNCGLIQLTELHNNIPEKKYKKPPFDLFTPQKMIENTMFRHKNPAWIFFKKSVKILREMQFHKIERRSHTTPFKYCIYWQAVFCFIPPTFITFWSVSLDPNTGCLHEKLSPSDAAA